MIEVPVRVKDALRDGRMLKNYRFNVLNDDGTVDFTIENDALVSESVKIDERMCTGNQLKFGLCEGSSLEFQYFDNPNITGRQIQAFIDVQYVDADNELQWYEIPMGFFTVDQCPMQFSTGIRKVTAYNKLRSEYLDQKANMLIEEAFDFGSVYVTDIVDYLLKDFSIDKKYEEATPSHTESYGLTYSKKSSTFTYSDLTGNQGPFGPVNLPTWGSVTTSTPIGFRVMAALKHYTSLSGYPVRLVLPDYLDEIDEEIKVFIRTQLGKIHTTTSIDTLWNRIRNLTYDSTDPYLDWEDKCLTNYIFSITIIYDDDSVDVYGNNAVNSKGSFAELSKITLLNVKTIYMLFPVDIGFYDPSDTSTGGDPSNTIYLTGRARRYYPNATDPYEYYYPPTFSDGSLITTEEVFDDFSVYKIIGGISDADFITVDPTQLSDVTLRDLQGAIYEMNCQYGKLDRETDLFSGTSLNNSRLLPADTLYPSDTLYPNGDSIRANKSMYQKLWTDSQGVQSFRYLIITYKGLDENNQEVEKVLQRTVNADGTTDYNMSDNWLFKNLVWSDADVGTYADAMVLKMQNVTWFPFEMWCAGLPYIETGDELEISNSEGTYTSYVLQRQLNGIQNLQDTFIDGELDIF